MQDERSCKCNNNGFLENPFEECCNNNNLNIGIIIILILIFTCFGCGR